MKVLIPQIETAKELLFMTSDGKHAPAKNILKLPDNAVFEASLLNIEEYDANKKYKIGDCCKTGDTVIMLIAVSEYAKYWQNIEYDGWNIILPTQFIAKKRNIFKKVGSYYFVPDSNNDKTSIFRYLGKDKDPQLIYEYDILLSDDTYSEVVIPSLPVWSPTTQYEKNHIVVTGIIYRSNGAVYTSSSKGKVFVSLQDNNTGNNPFEHPEFWKEQFFVSQMAMFDDWNSTSWKFYNQSLHAVFDGKDKNAIAIFQAKAESIKVTWNERVEKEVLLKERYPINYQEYFFKKFNSSPRSFLFESPFLKNHQVMIDVKGDDNSIGTIVTGSTINIGKTALDWEKRNRDFSDIQTDEGGFDYIEKGNNSKVYTVNVVIPNAKSTQIFNLLEENSSKLCVWIINRWDFVFGWYKDAIMTKENEQTSEYMLEIKGVI